VAEIASAPAGRLDGSVTRHPPPPTCAPPAHGVENGVRLLIDEAREHLLRVSSCARVAAPSRQELIAARSPQS
jgi:hypothetical protein